MTELTSKVYHHLVVCGLTRDRDIRTPAHDLGHKGSRDGMYGAENRPFIRPQDRPIGDHKQPLIGNDAYSTAQDSVKPSDDAYLPMSPVNAKPSSTQPAKSLADSGNGDNKFKLIPKLDFPLGNKDDGGLQFMYPVNHK